MRISNLIMTPTQDMSREEWLEFRSPYFHVRKFLQNYYETQVDSKGMAEGYLNSTNAYEFLKYVFTTDQWKQFDFPCVGASEISCLLGLNPYKSSIEFYYEKVGIKEPWNEDNAAMYWGRTLEETIANEWQYWDGSFESLMLNKRLGKIVRRCRRINFYVQNKATPWIFVSLDRVINKHQGKEEGLLECKTISEYAAKQWEGGIPPMYAGQLQTQLLTFEMSWGEMALLKDGRNYEVLPFDYSEHIGNRLKEESKIFYETIKEAIVHFFLWKSAPESEKQFHLSEIERLSPEPDNSLAYENYLSEQWKSEADGHEIMGGEEQLHWAKSYKHYGGKLKVIEGIQRECSNRIMNFMKDASKLDFGEAGKVTWKTNKKGSRVLLFGVKVEEDFVPDPEIIKSMPQEEEQPLF